jgi:hypothetical protein
MIVVIPWGPTFIISLGESLAELQSLKAPTLLVDVMMSPEMLSTQAIAEIPVGYFSKTIAKVRDSREINSITPF